MPIMIIKRLASLDYISYLLIIVGIIGLGIPLFFLLAEPYFNWRAIKLVQNYKLKNNMAVNEYVRHQFDRNRLDIHWHASEQYSIRVDLVITGKDNLTHEIEKYAWQVDSARSKIYVANDNARKITPELSCRYDIIKKLNKNTEQFDLGGESNIFEKCDIIERDRR